RLQLLDPSLADQFLKSQHDGVSFGFETESMARFFKEGFRDVEGGSHIKELRLYASRRQVDSAGGAGEAFGHFAGSMRRSIESSRSQSWVPRMTEASSSVMRSSLRA